MKLELKKEEITPYLPFKLNKTTSLITTGTNSKIYFKDTIEKVFLNGLRFNYVSIHETEVNPDFIKNRGRL